MTDYSLSIIFRCVNTLTSDLFGRARNFRSSL